MPAFLFGPPAQLTEEQQEAADEHRLAAEALEKRMKDEHIRARLLVSRWAAITCSCRRWYVWGDGGPPQDGCIVHGQATIRYDTGEVI
jgi:hypothetical protein